MTKAKHSWGPAGVVDGLCAATGWNRYYATGYLVVWHEAALLTGREWFTATELRWTLPEQPGVSLHALIEIFAKLGLVRQEVDGWIITAHSPRKKRKHLVRSACKGHWDEYARAYESRYWKQPLRNAKQNSIMKRIEQRVPCDDMDELLRFYLAHNDYRYTIEMHALYLLERHAEALHTQMKTGRLIMSGKARQDAKTDETKAQAARILRGEI